MSQSQFACSLKFKDAWQATPDEVGVLLDRITESLEGEGVTGLRIGGDIIDAVLDIVFDVPRTEEDLDTEDSLLGMGFVVRALNYGRVSAPGWPSDHVIDQAIASVRVRDFALVDGAAA